MYFRRGKYIVILVDYFYLCCVDSEGLVIVRVLFLVIM